MTGPFPPHGDYSPPAAAAAYRMALAIMAAELEPAALEAIALEVHRRLQDAGDDPVAVLEALEAAYLEHLDPGRRRLRALTERELFRGYITPAHNADRSTTAPPPGDLSRAGSGASGDQP